jgi:hypothetical protein
MLKRQCDVTCHHYEQYEYAQVLQACFTFIFHLLMMAFNKKPNLVAEVFKYKLCSTVYGFDYVQAHSVLAKY